MHVYSLVGRGSPRQWRVHHLRFDCENIYAIIKITHAKLNIPIETYRSTRVRTVCDEEDRIGGNIANSVVNFALILSDVFLIRVFDVQIGSFVDKRDGISAG